MKLSLQAAVEALMNNEMFDVESDDDRDTVYQSDEEINWNNIGVPENFNSNEGSSLHDQSSESFEDTQNLYDQIPSYHYDFENKSDGPGNKMSRKQAATE